MSLSPRTAFLGISCLISIASVLALVAACSSDSTPAGATADGGTSSGSSTSGATATCASPGAPTAGTADTHCADKKQEINAASCTVTDAGADAGAGGDEDCEFGATQFGSLEGFDDDCKYKVTVTTSPICSGTAAVNFKVTVVGAVDGKPATGIADGLNIEVYQPTDATAACDSKTNHPSPSTDSLKETTAGSGVYSGGIIFDAPGQWTVRFHIHEECADILEDSPHGHIAFRLTVP